jgi:hypothetical protein
VRILINLPDLPRSRSLDADHAMSIAFSSALATELDTGRIEVSLDGGRKTFLFQAAQSELSHRHAIGLADAVGAWQRPPQETLRDQFGCTVFQVQLLDRADSRLIAEYEFTDSGEQSLTEQALGLLWQNERMVDRLVHKVYLRGRPAEDRRWKTIELELGEQN